MRLLRVTRVDGSNETFGVPDDYSADYVDLYAQEWLMVPGADGASFAIRLEGVAWLSAYDEAREAVPA